MKKHFNIITKITLVLSLLVVSSCETTELDLQDNPNALTLNSADPNFVLNSMQLGFVGQHLQLSQISRGTMRHTAQFGTYGASSGTATMNGPWASTYAIVNNLNLLQDISEQAGLPNHVGIGQVLEAFAYVNLVDYIGTAVFTEAVNSEFPNPNLDDGELIYDAMFAQLNEAIVNLNGTNTVAVEDLFYQGDLSSWVKLANTLKIKMFVQTKLVANANAVADINAILASGNYIKEIDDDFIARFGTLATNPDVRHPDFVGNYLTQANTYMSNDFMNTLLNGKSIQDPRMRHFIYRQTIDDPTGTLLPCEGDTSFQFCYIGNGYWGRDHADNEGIPNDGQFRATFGAYPAGGAFDNDNFVPSATSNNAGGAGVQPMILSSFSKFMLAEAALPAPAGLGVNGNSRTFLNDALTDSFNQVSQFTGVAMIDVATYINEVLAEYDAAGDDQERLNIIIREYYIASWGNSIEAYNSYRRTGFPTLGLSVITNTSFPRSYFLPASELNSNDNPDIVQKLITDQVFWDTNPAGFID